MLLDADIPVILARVGRWEPALAVFLRACERRLITLGASMEHRGIAVSAGLNRLPTGRHGSSSPVAVLDVAHPSSTSDPDGVLPVFSPVIARSEASFFCIP
jgi:hypothetical protein